MAKIEVNTFLGSSQDNFLVFSNDNYEKPFVTFYFKTGQNPVGTLTIKDALDDDGYSKTIEYSPSELITDSSFKCMPDRTVSTFALLECLKKNVIFYNIEIISNIPNVGMIIKAYIDSSTRYEIKTTSSIIVIGGTYMSYVSKEPNKFVVMLNDGENQVALEKYTMAEDVGFNVTAPYEHLSFKNPFQLNMMAYHIDNNTVITDTIANNSVVVFPTTLSKFDDTNLADYNYTYVGQKVNFLTHNFTRYYNYGEVCALSVMTSKSGVGLLKKFYTVSGKFLSQDQNVLYSESPTNRRDFYFENDIATVENVTNKKVGYIDVVATYGGAEITKPIRYNVVAKCNQNNEIFFVNELGGIDSFNFLGERTYESRINKQTTYFMNHIRQYTNTKELEVIGQKRNKVEHNLKSAIIDSDTARWLNELSKSKYPFLYKGGSVKFERIVVTEMNIDISDRENTFEVELTYRTGDNDIAI